MIGTAAVITTFALAAGSAGGQSAVPKIRSTPYFGYVFSFVDVGETSDVVEATIINSGPVTTKIDSSTINGVHANDFFIDNDGCAGRTLPVGAECKIGLRFRPTVAGTRVAGIVVRFADETCQHWIGVAGSGTSTTKRAMARAASTCGPATQPPEQQPDPENPTPQTGGSSDSKDAPQDPSTAGGIAFARECGGSRRRIRIRLFAPRGLKIRSAKVWLNGKPVKTRKVRGRYRAVINLRGRRKGVSVVRIRLRASNGKIYKGRRLYRHCQGRGPIGTPRY